MKVKYLASLVAGLLIVGSVPAYSDEHPQDQPKTEKPEAKKVKPHSHPSDAKGIGSGEPVTTEQPAEVNPNTKKHHHPRDAK